MIGQVQENPHYRQSDFCQIITVLYGTVFVQVPGEMFSYIVNVTGMFKTSYYSARKTHDHNRRKYSKW